MRLTMAYDLTSEDPPEPYLGDPEEPTKWTQDATVERDCWAKAVSPEISEYLDWVRSLNESALYTEGMTRLIRKQEHLLNKISE